MKKKKYNSKVYDLKSNPTKSWPYTGDPLTNKKYLKDRSELFAEAGNGWWRLVGTPDFRIHMEKIRKENENGNEKFNSYK